MTTIDRTKLKAVRADLDKALLELAKTHGVLMTIGALRFDANQATGRLTISAASGVTAAAIEDATAPADIRNSQAEADYKRLCVGFNLSPDWLGKNFTMNGSTFTLVGLLPNKHKNCCLIRRVSTGKHFIASPTGIQNAFA